MLILIERYKFNLISKPHFIINKSDFSFAVNPGSSLGQAQKCGRVKPVNGIPTL
jgi:hypothetical protein